MVFSSEEKFNGLMFENEEDDDDGDKYQYCNFYSCNNNYY